MDRADVLKKAEAIVTGSRESWYGSPEHSFAVIADLWTAYILNGRDETMFTELTQTDVACMMALLKVARIRTGGGTEDSWVDLAGYAACGGELNA